MSKKTCFDKAIDLMKGYSTLKTDLNKNYESQVSSGRYSRNYLNDLQQADQQRLSRERMTIATRLDQLKADYSKELDKDFALNWATNGAESVNTYTLEKLVHSGIEPSAQEFEALAKQYSKSYYASRMLHDFAKRCGYDLQNIPDREDCERRFDRFCTNIQNSLDPANMLPVFTDADMARLAAEGNLNMMENPPMVCRKTPTTFEESIAAIAEDEQRDRARENAMSAEEQAKEEALFKQGFDSVPLPYGSYQQQTTDKATSKLQKAIDNMTYEEQEDAKFLARYLHGSDEITEAEVDWIRSKDYAAMKADRNKSRAEKLAETEAKAKEPSSAQAARDQRIDEGIKKIEKLNAELQDMPE